MKNVKVPTEKENACTGVLTGNQRTYTLIIPGRLPGLNEYISAERTNRYQAAAMKRDAQAVIGWAIKKHLPGVHITQPVIMSYNWIEPNKKRDKDNISGFGRKVIQDALVMSGVLADDGWDEILMFTDTYGIDKADPRIVVDITTWELTSCLDTTTSDAVNTTGKDVSASTAAGTTTDTKATSDAAPGTGETAGTARGRARTTSKRRKGR